MSSFKESIVDVWDETKSTNGLIKFAYVLITGAILLALWFLFFGNYFTGNILSPDPLKAKDIQPFVSGLVLPLLSLGSTLLVISNLRSANIQNFSNNFFKLIDQHHRLVSNIDSQIEGYPTSSKGHAFFDDLASRIAWDFEQISNQNYKEEEPGSERQFTLDGTFLKANKDKRGRELVVALYDHYFHLHHSDLSHFFRNLFHIVKFVERSSIGSSLKVEYLRMLRAQLSNYEMLLLAYDGMHEYGQAFYPFIEKYELIKSLNNETRMPSDYEQRIVDIKILKEAYPQLVKYWK